MSETDLDELINVRLPKSEKKFFDSYLSRALSSDITSGKSPGNNLMIREFLNLLEENPTAPTHTQSEIGFIQIEPYFKGLEINNPNSSNYLDQMTTNDREYFMESQNEIYLHIQQIAQEYKKNKKLSEEKSFIRAETIGVVGHKKDLLQIYSFPSKQSSKPRKTTISDFELLKPLSHGAFGKVCLCRKIASGDIFAIKILDRHEVLAKSQEELIKTEKQVLEIVDNDFVVRGVYTFQSANYLYFVMEYMRGGDLGSLLENMGYLEEQYARIYLAEIVLALEYLHSNGVIHRDMKPDNILIDAKGHTKLTDFGLSDVGLQKRANELMATGNTSRPYISGSTGLQKEEYFDTEIMKDFGKISNFKINSKNMKRIVGTPDYLAPELIKEGNKNKNVDWWAVGVIAYELMTGVRPFGAEKMNKVFENIINLNISYPKVGTEEGQISENALDFMKSLLDPNPRMRLGSKGSEEVKNHPFFKGVKWNSLREDEPPFIPEIENVLDTQYFNQNKANFATIELLKDEPRAESRLIDHMPSPCSKANEESAVLDDFEGTMYLTLAGLNKQAAVDAQKQHDEESKYKARKKHHSMPDYSIQKLDLLKKVADHNPLFSKKSKTDRRKTKNTYSRFKGKN